MAVEYLNQITTAGQIGGLGTVNVYAVPSGEPTLPVEPIPFVVNANAEYRAISPCDNGNAFSLMRIIGGGFEVHNDTAELYKKGSVTVYNQPTELQDAPLRVGLDGAAPNSFGIVRKSRLPPGNVSTATANVTSRTWEARDGCYVPFQLDVTDLKFQQATGQGLVMPAIDTSLDFGYQTQTWGTELDLLAVGPTFTFRSDSPIRYAGLETVGAYFSGLGPETVLTLDVRFIVEIAPTPANTTLISLATPSSQYDPQALVLYSKAVRELPPGVKVNMNAAGDWWKLISDAARKVAPVIKTLGPYGQAAGHAVSMAADFGDMVAKIRNEGKKKKEEGKAGTKSDSGNRNPASSSSQPKNRS
jgi:hypothetical protein